MLQLPDKKIRIIVTMSGIQKFLTVIFAFIIAIALFAVVLKPLFVSKYIAFAKKHARGQYICTLDNQGNHVSKLYKISNGKKTLVKTTQSNSCIFSRPKVNAGFFVFMIGGGGGATPYESGNSGGIISKYKLIQSPIIIIKIGKGGHGTFMDKDAKFIDAKDGEATTIKDLKLYAKGGSKSTRMTPLGKEPKIVNYHIPNKYHYLYDIPKSAKYGAGGTYNKYTKDSSAQAASGHSGAVIIQW